VAAMIRLRVTDRMTGTVLGEGRPGADPDPTADPAVGTPPVVLPLEDGAIEVVVEGWRFVLEVEDADRADLRARASHAHGATDHTGPTQVRAMIPGRIASVAVAQGDAVTAGQRLLSVEAMKMENEIRSPRDGTVEKIAVAPGDLVENGDIMVVIG